MRSVFYIVLAWFALCACPFVQADWTTFRGQYGASAAMDSNPPVEFSSAEDVNIAWKVPMPGRSAAGPLVIGNKVITTSSSGVDNQRIYVTAVDIDNGQELWSIDLVCRGRPYSHPTSTNAAPTAASDGERVFAFYSSNDLICIGLDGQLQWYRSLDTEYPRISNDVGMSSSPVIADGVVAVQMETQGESFLLGMEANTGKTLWRVNRPRSANWNSPVVVQASNEQPFFLTTSAQDAVGIEPKTGKELFSIASSASTIASATGSSNKFFIPEDGLAAWSATSYGATPEKLWTSKKLKVGNSSPVVVGEKIYVVNGSVLSQGKAEDGEDEWKLRLPEAGTIWATPVVCGNRMYVFSDNGKCFVAKIGESKGELLATNEIEDGVLGSPAVVGDAIIVRSDRYLWKIAHD